MFADEQLAKEMAKGVMMPTFFQDGATLPAQPKYLKLPLKKMQNNGNNIHLMSSADLNQIIGSIFSVHFKSEKEAEVSEALLFLCNAIAGKKSTATVVAQHATLQHFMDLLCPYRDGLYNFSLRTRYRAAYVLVHTFLQSDWQKKYCQTSMMFLNFMMTLIVSMCEQLSSDDKVSIVSVSFAHIVLFICCRVSGSDLGLLLKMLRKCPIFTGDEITRIFVFIAKQRPKTPELLAPLLSIMGILTPLVNSWLLDGMDSPFQDYVSPSFAPVLARAVSFFGVTKVIIQAIVDLDLDSAFLQMILQFSTSLWTVVADDISTSPEVLKKLEQLTPVYIKKVGAFGWFRYLFMLIFGQANNPQDRVPVWRHAFFSSTALQALAETTRSKSAYIKAKRAIQKFHNLINAIYVVLLHGSDDDCLVFLPHLQTLCDAATMVLQDTDLLKQPDSNMRHFAYETLEFSAHLLYLPLQHQNLIQEHKGILAETVRKQHIFEHVMRFLQFVKEVPAFEALEMCVKSILSTEGVLTVAECRSLLKEKFDVNISGMTLDSFVQFMKQLVKSHPVVRVSYRAGCLAVILGSLFEENGAFMAYRGKELSKGINWDDALVGKEFRVCSFCGNTAKEGIKLQRCSGCHSVRYCSKECQMQHWKSGHSKQCKSMQQQKEAASASNVGEATPAPAPSAAPTESSSTPTATSSSSPIDISSMSVGQLKTHLRAAQIDISACVEKSELVALAQKHLAAK